jgi:ribosomal protein S18 acetylase RimI-like enzyme
MTRTPTVRRLAAHEWRLYRDLRLRALADTPDAFERTFDEARALPDDAWRARLAEGASSKRSLPLVAELYEPVGLAWGRIAPEDPETTHVFQMWVAPSGRRQGAGRLLLDTIVAWATENRTRYVALGVTLGDTPAARLYARAGFQPVGEPGPLRPGSPVLGQPMRLELTR